mmetsp:Transcript_3559/g.22375  ORF Transcript_3559/g.22375 Transcript_3559/m.22375 type:complete len:130 (+) Transcript_3559:3334-3723(+)
MWASMLQASRAKSRYAVQACHLVLPLQLQVCHLLCAIFSTPKCLSLWHVINAPNDLHYHSIMLLQNHVAPRTFATCLNQLVKHSKPSCGKVALSIFTDASNHTEYWHSTSMLHFDPRKGQGIYTFTHLH